MTFAKIGLRDIDILCESKNLFNLRNGKNWRKNVRTTFVEFDIYDRMT